MQLVRGVVSEVRFHTKVFIVELVFCLPIVDYFCAPCFYGHDF